VRGAARGFGPFTPCRRAFAARPAGWPITLGVTVRSISPSRRLDSRPTSPQIPARPRPRWWRPFAVAAVRGRGGRARSSTLQPRLLRPTLRPGGSAPAQTAGPVPRRPSRGDGTVRAPVVAISYTRWPRTSLLRPGPLPCPLDQLCVRAQQIFVRPAPRGVLRTCSSNAVTPVACVNESAVARVLHGVTVDCAIGHNWLIPCAAVGALRRRLRSRPESRDQSYGLQKMNHARGRRAITMAPLSFSEGPRRTMRIGAPGAAGPSAERLQST